jgi:hypothetical protein
MNLILQWAGIVAGIMTIGGFAWKFIIKPLIKIMKEYKEIKEMGQEYKRKDNEIIDKIDGMKTEVMDEIQALRTENTMLFKGTHACLDGLIQMNCNGPVTECKAAFDKYVDETFKNR